MTALCVKVRSRADIINLHCDFVQEWLEQTNGGLWLTTDFFISNEFASSLEVLSEHCLCPSLPSLPLPPKASRALTTGRKEDVRGVNKGLDESEPLEDGNSPLTEGWRATPQDQPLIDCLKSFHQNPVPRYQSSLLESQDAYVTLCASNHKEEKHLDDIQEALLLNVLFASRKHVLFESHSDLGSIQQSSGSGRLSSQSSFEYSNHNWMPKGPGYTYMGAADSGVSIDYSPMSRVDDIGKVVIYANEYKNKNPVDRRAFLLSQHFNKDNG